jgi:23S rRNA (guanosine2251-2'-O)-methyltransferase
MRKIVEERMSDIVLVLDSVRSKENVGALFRTGDAAGVSEVVLCGITPQPVNRFGNIDSKIAKAALGAELCVSWRYAASCANVVRDMQKNKRKEKDGAQNATYKVVVLEQAPESIDYTAVTCGRNETIVLVVGNEVDGVSADVLALADTVMHIPMHGKKESLNVTTATGIALFSLIRT